MPIDDGAGGQEDTLTSVVVGIEAGAGIEDDSNPSFAYQLTVYYRPSKALLASVAKANKDKVIAGRV